MSKILDILEKEYPSEKSLILHRNFQVKFKDLLKYETLDLEKIQEGDVVAIIGDYEPATIKTFLKLIDKKTIIIPLTKDTKSDHDYYFKEACVDYVIENNTITKIKNKRKNDLLSKFRKTSDAGLILFSSGTTGRPKAILHSMSTMLKRYVGKKKPLITMNFLLFDHIGGINTLLYTLFNSGQLVIPYERNVTDVVKDIEKFAVELLPTTPTFLRMLLFDNNLNLQKLKSLKIITYGAELMDEYTLQHVAKLLPDVNLRQTYGMSEIGILRVRSESNTSLWIQIGGEGVEKKIDNNVLYLKTKNRMFGYLNEKSPFDKNGWYNTNDIVESKQDGHLKIVGRKSDVISVGGLKILPSEVERVALKNNEIKNAKAYGRNNPVTGQHVEIICEPKKNLKNNQQLIENLKKNFKKELHENFVPLKIKFDKINYSYRYKKR